MDARFRFRSGRITEMVMQMKKPGILLVLLLAAVLLTGCGSSQPAAPAAKEAAVPEQTDAPVSPETARLPEASEETAGSLKAAVEAAVGDAAELAPFTAEELTDMTGIVPEDVADFVFLQGNGMDGREILVIRAKDEASADRVASLLEKYLGTVEAKTIIDLGIPIQGGFLSGDRIEEVVMTLTHDLSFDETRIPFVCIATDLMTGEMKAFDKGKLHRAVRASMAVPGVFTPALIDDHYYVDGGVLEELPVSVLRERGADVVITSDLGIKRNFFDPEHPSPIDVLRRSSDIMQARLTERQADKGDVVIRPDASFMGLLKINGYEESVEAGRQKALEALPRIRELLGMDGIDPEKVDTGHRIPYPFGRKETGGSQDERPAKDIP